MAMTVDPCLGPDGWIVNETTIGSKKIARYFLSHASQSVVYRGSVRSINKDMAVASNNPDKLVEVVEESLLQIFSDSFKDVSVNVRYTLVEDTKVQLFLNVVFGTRTKSILKYSVLDALESPKLMTWLNGEWVGVVKPTD